MNIERRHPAGLRSGGVLARASAIALSAPYAIRATAVVVFFIVWHYASIDADPLFLVSPLEVARAGWQQIVSGHLYSAFIASMPHFLLGLAISIFGGILIGVMIGQWWFFEYTMDSFINALYAVPRVALIPLIIMWFGLDTLAKVVILVSIAIFPVIINTYSGIKDTRGTMLDVGRSFGATETQIFFKIIVPGMVPHVMSGVRLCVGLAIIGMITAEFFTAQVGLGRMVRDSADNFQMADVYFVIIVIGALGIALTELSMWVERKLSYWRILRG